jgi:hypothetical protein
VPNEDNWCWEQGFINVDVGAEDVAGIAFVQKGYWINVISTHDVDASMIKPDGSPIDLKIKVVFPLKCVLEICLIASDATHNFCYIDIQL